MARPLDKICNQCNAHDPIDETKGHCKKHRATRRMKIASMGTESSAVPVNGWPIVMGHVNACGDFE